MTHFLVNALRSAGAGATYRDVLDVVGGRVSEMFSTQHPQLEGVSADQVVFGDKASLADTYVGVTSVNAGSVELAAGDSHGVTVGSVYEVYPAGTKQFRPGQGLVSVKVTAVAPFSATAAPESPATIQPASRAVERQHRFASPRLHVALDDADHSATLQRIRADLAPYPGIAVVADASQCDLRVAEKDGSVEVRGLGSIEPLSKVAIDASVVKNAIDGLVSWSQWVNLRRLENPASALKVRFATSIPNAALTQGEQFTFTVENVSDTDLFLAVIDFSTDGSVTPVYPPPGQHPRLASDRKS